MPRRRLFVLAQHGSHGTAADFARVADAARRRLCSPAGGFRDVVICAPRTNEGLRTDDGVWVCAARAVPEVEAALSAFRGGAGVAASAATGPAASPGAEGDELFFSCVGHSFGGIINREVMRRLLERRPDWFAAPPCGDDLPTSAPCAASPAALASSQPTGPPQLRLLNFVTVATPHCGVRRLPAPLYAGAWAIGVAFSQNYLDLLTPARGPRRSLRSPPAVPGGLPPTADGPRGGADAAAAAPSPPHGDGVAGLVSQLEAAAVGPLGAPLLSPAHLDALRRFHRRVSFANRRGDLLVGFETAALWFPELGPAPPQWAGPPSAAAAAADGHVQPAAELQPLPPAALGALVDRPPAPDVAAAAVLRSVGAWRVVPVVASAPRWFPAAHDGILNKRKLLVPDWGRMPDAAEAVGGALGEV